MSGGRHLAKEAEYARELGIVAKRPFLVVRRLGGVERLRSLSPEARAVLLAPLGCGNSRTVADGGLAARGMRRRVAAGLPPREEEDDFLIPPHVDFDMPIEALLSDEDLPEVEGLGEMDEA